MESVSIKIYVVHIDKVVIHLIVLGQSTLMTHIRIVAKSCNKKAFVGKSYVKFIDIKMDDKYS